MLPFGKEGMMRQRQKICLSGGEIFPAKVSIKLIEHSPESTGATQYWTAEVTRSLSDDAVCPWDALWFMFFYSSAFLLDVFFQTLPLCTRGQTPASVHACACLFAGTMVSRLSDTPVCYFARRCRPWVHDSVLMSRLMHTERVIYIFSGVCVWSEITDAVQNHCTEDHFCDRSQRLGREREKQL